MSMIFKGTLTIYFLIAIAALAAAGSVLFRPLAAEAHAAPPPADSAETAPVQTAADPGVLFGFYVYRAEKGDNLTYFARRSVQLHLTISGAELAKFDVARTIAAETFIVRDLGGFGLAVGQEVGIDAALVAQRVHDARELDEASLARWAAYAPVRQSLNHIEPLEIPRRLVAGPATPIEEEPAPETTAEEEQLVPDGSPEAAAPATAPETAPEPDISETAIPADNATATRDSSFYFTLLGGLILIGIVVWVLVLSFVRNTKDEAEATDAGNGSKRGSALAGRREKTGKPPGKTAKKRSRPAEKAGPAGKKPARVKKRK